MTPRTRKNALRLALVLALLVLVIAGFLLQGPSRDVALSGPGPEGVIEQARYVFDWNGLTAGMAEFTLSRRLDEGRPMLHFTGRARTSEGLDMLWRMRDSVIAFVDGHTLGPRRFQLFRRENKKRIDLDVVHDLGESKFRISRVKSGRIRKGTVPSAGVYDPVSAMLILRRKPLNPGDVETIRVLEGKRIYEVSLRSLGRERILIGTDRLPAIKLAMTYRSEDGRRSSDDDGIDYTYVWVGSEPAHPLLRLEAGAFAGVISGERVAQGEPGFPLAGDS